ncbi:MAG: efflux RND transporter permease subunit [Rhodocyclaceae bacterium]|nr:MAG: efflux RND transporter permease subunit [Rhodocyclaceae bacterium]
MRKINLSAWALEHSQMVVYLMAVLLLAGILSFFKLGRSEDPPFTFKVMVVRTLWPGATVKEVESQLTERIEKKLQDTPWIDVVRSASRPGESLIFVLLKDYTPPKEVPDAWYQVRKQLNDIRGTLPAGVVGPFPNDEFGDVDILIYGLTGDGFNLAELRRYADDMALDLRGLKDVKKIEMFGVQEERINVDVSPSRLASLGLTPKQISDALQQQNAVAPSGFVETASDRIQLRVTGRFDGVEAVRAVPLIANGKTVKLGEFAKVSRGFVDPPSPQMRIDGKPAVAFGVVIAKGGNVPELGARVGKRMKELQSTLPAGVDVHVVADQPEVVRSSIELFVHSLAEAVVIVLAVSFLSLGLRTGTVVALSIPLVLALTFLLMKVFGVDLQRISLGALVIALGLLVDDAIIAVEMMVVKMEQGWDRFSAATHAYTSTAFPMLTGTLITAAGFLPVAFAQSAAGEYTFSIFAVVTIALLTSWVVAVVFTPWLGHKLLDPVALVAKAQKHGEDIYDTPFYRRFRALVDWCLVHRWRVIAATAAAFGVTLVLFGVAVQKQFFPASSRPELLVDIWLPQTASLRASGQEAQRVEELLAKEPTVESYYTYVGNGAPRFYLPLDQQLFSDNFAQIVAVTKGLEEREVLKAKLDTLFDGGDPAWSHLRVRTGRLENGPPVGYPVQFRASGPDAEVVRGIAAQVAELMRGHGGLRDVHLDWNEKVKSVRVEVDQERARVLGVNSQDIALTLQAWLNGAAMTQYREGDRLIDVTWRAGREADGRGDELMARLPELDIAAANGNHVPLAQVAKLVPVLEDGVIWRRNRLPTITVRADLADQKVQAPTISMALEPKMDALRAKLPVGYHIEMGGAIEESAKGSDSIVAVMPLMLLTVVTLLMMQLQSISRTVMVVLTAPLGLIGVLIGLLVFQAPFGFVANLGVIALMGMIMRNSVILMDQIEQDERAGKSQWEAIVSSTVRRFRPIVLTAAAAILAMIPLTRQVFWGPMAIAIMGGLMVATALTCLFLPALYAAWFKVRRETAE